MTPDTSGGGCEGDKNSSSLWAGVHTTPGGCTPITANRKSYLTNNDPSIPLTKESPPGEENCPHQPLQVHMTLAAYPVV